MVIEQAFNSAQSHFTKASFVIKIIVNQKLRKKRHQH